MSTCKDVYVENAKYGDAKQIENAVENLLANLPAMQNLTPESKVLLKPNLLAKRKPEKAVTTHPHVLKAVIIALQNRGIKHITVADSSGGKHTEQSMQNIYAQSGLKAVCDETGVVLSCLPNSVKRTTNGKLLTSFNLLTCIDESDFIINLPKLKTHVLTGMSGAVKNLFGCIPGIEKAELHMRLPQKEHFGQMLVDLCECVKADVHLMDGVLAMEGDGPGGGTPRECNLLLASENPYSLDLAVCRYMGMQPISTPTLKAAYENGLCDDSFDEIFLHGTDFAKRPFKNFVLPRSQSGLINFESSFPAFLRPLVLGMGEIIAPKPVIIKQKCIGCGKCAEICPKNVISLPNKKAEIAKKNCIRCFCCHEICPVDAIDIRRFFIFG